MITRSLLRIKIVQLLFAYCNNPSKSIQIAEKELFKSIQQSYTLYHYLLLLITEITFYAEKRIVAAQNKLRPTEAEKNPNKRFIENLFAEQLSKNDKLKEYLKEYKLSFADHQQVIKNIFEQISESAFYQEYMEFPSSVYNEKRYETDKELWRKIVKSIIAGNEELTTMLEEQNLYWNDDMETISSFVLKTIKRFDEEKSRLHPLLPMFNDEQDSEYAARLFRETITHAEEYKAIIDRYTKHWETERVATMDMVIMEVAIAELLNFPTIPVNVTLNEYIEIAKHYSTDRSSIFVNGILNNLVNQLKSDNKLIKAKIIN